MPRKTIQQRPRNINQSNIIVFGARQNSSFGSRKRNSNSPDCLTNVSGGKHNSFTARRRAPRKTKHLYSDITHEQKNRIWKDAIKNFVESKLSASDIYREYFPNKPSIDHCSSPDKVDTVAISGKDLVDISPYYHKRIDQVAEIFNMSASNFCKKYKSASNGQKWPRRELLALNTSLSQAKEALNSQLDTASSSSKIQTIKTKIMGLEKQLSALTSPLLMNLRPPMVNEPEQNINHERQEETSDEPLSEQILDTFASLPMSITSSGSSRTTSTESFVEGQE